MTKVLLFLLSCLVQLAMSHRPADCHLAFSPKNCSRVPQNCIWCIPSNQCKGFDVCAGPHSTPCSGNMLIYRHGDKCGPGEVFIVALTIMCILLCIAVTFGVIMVFIVSTHDFQKQELVADYNEID